MTYHGGRKDCLETARGRLWSPLRPGLVRGIPHGADVVGSVQRVVQHRVVLRPQEIAILGNDGRVVGPAQKRHDVFHPNAL